MALAKAAKVFSGADIQAAIDVAVEKKLEASFKGWHSKTIEHKRYLKSHKKDKTKH